LKAASNISINDLVKTTSNIVAFGLSAFMTLMACANNVDFHDPGKPLIQKFLPVGKYFSKKFLCSVSNFGGGTVQFPISILY
jgi:hypothetical protein